MNPYNDRLAAEAKARRAMMLEAHHLGRTVTELAKQTGISKQRVSQLLKKAREEV